VAKPKSNNKYKLFQLVNKHLSEEKFLEGKKLTNKKNKIIRIMTTDDMHLIPSRSPMITCKNKINIVENSKFEDVEIKKTQQYKRSNTIDDEDEEKNDLIIENLESRNKEQNLIERDRNFYTEETPDSFREINLGVPEIDCLANGGSFKEVRIPSHSKFKHMYISQDPYEKYDTVSFHSNGMESEGGSSLEIKVIEKIQAKKNVKIKFLKGDLSHPDEFEEHLFSNFLKTITKQGSVFKPRQSCLVHLIEKEELNIIRERSPTPIKERKESLVRYTSPLKKSKSNEKLPSIISINGKEIHIADKSVIELKKDENFMFNKSLGQKKRYSIYSNENSTIKLPSDCRNLFIL
jgi:hypothetical protein